MPQFTVDNPPGSRSRRKSKTRRKTTKKRTARRASARRTKRRTSRRASPRRAPKMARKRTRRRTTRSTSRKALTRRRRRSSGGSTKLLSQANMKRAVYGTAGILGASMIPPRLTFLPEQLRSGYGLAATQVAVGVGAGMLLRKFAGRDAATAVAVGAFSAAGLTIATNLLAGKGLSGFGDPASGMYLGGFGDPGEDMYLGCGPMGDIEDEYSYGGEYEYVD